MQEKILFVDDEHKIQRFVRANLVASKYEVFLASNGKEALDVFERCLPDMVLLDIMMPIMDGFDFLRTVREFSSVPIIIITAKGNQGDIIKGLELGADDYIVKPFDIQELLARMKTVLRRVSSDIDTSEETNLCVGKISINFSSLQVSYDGKIVECTPTEFKVLAELVRHAGCVMTHEDLLVRVWGHEYRNEVQYVRVCIARLRQKFNITKSEAGYIKTVPTVGYMMEN